MDYLEEAKNSIGRAQVSPVEEEAMVNAQLAIACALVAMVERLDALTEFDGGKSLFVTLTK